MGLRINHNVAAVNAHRNLVQNDAKLSKTLEHLSSGNKINRASDGPASLVISEQMRAQVAGLSQAVMNSENAVSMVQTAEANLNEVSTLLVGMRQLAIHAANEGGNDQKMLEADQAELLNALDSIDRISKSAQYGRKTLLDGSHSINGSASGPDLEFIKAGIKTQSSPQSGYQVTIDQESTQSQVAGAKPLTSQMIDAGELLTVQENGKTVQLTTKLGESYEKIQNRLNAGFEESGMKLDAFFDKGKLTIIHRDYGSKAGFSVTSSTDGVLSTKGDTPMWVQNGRDVIGKIGGEVANGVGQTLTGAKGTNVAGLEVRFTGVADPLKPEVGRVGISSNPFTFQVGGNRNQIVQVAIPDMNTTKLARNVNNETGYQSLRDLDLRNSAGAQDSLLLIDEAIDQVTTTRATMGAMQKNTLESNLSSLSVARENLINAESVLRDTDMASEMSDLTRHQIMTQSATAMLAQANQTPRNVLTLLK